MEPCKVVLWALFLFFLWYYSFLRSWKKKNYELPTMQLKSKKESKQYYQKISVFCSFCPLLNLISYQHAQGAIYLRHQYLKAICEIYILHLKNHILVTRSIPQTSLGETLSCLKVFSYIDILDECYAGKIQMKRKLKYSKQIYVN